MNRCTSGLRSLTDATLYASMMACAIVLSFTIRRFTKMFCGPALRALLGQRRHEAEDPDARRLLPHLHQVLAIRRRAGRTARGSVLTGGHSSTVRPRARQREPDLRVRQRQLRHHPRDLRRLGRVRLQELPARRQVVEEVRRPRRIVPSGAPTSRTDDDACRRSPGSPSRSAAPRGRVRSDELRHRRDARQRLAAEPVGHDGGQVVGPSRSCSSRAGRAPAAASSGSMPSPSSSTRISFLPPSSHGDRHARRAGVDGVLDQFLDDRRRALDDLAGGDLVGEFGGEAVDSAHGSDFGDRLAACDGGLRPGHAVTLS